MHSKLGLLSAGVQHMAHWSVCCIDSDIARQLHTCCSIPRGFCQGRPPDSLCLRIWANLQAGFVAMHTCGPCMTSLIWSLFLCASITSAHTNTPFLIQYLFSIIKWVSMLLSQKAMYAWCMVCCCSARSSCSLLWSCFPRYIVCLAFRIIPCQSSCYLHSSWAWGCAEKSISPQR